MLTYVALIINNHHACSSVFTHWGTNSEQIQTKGQKKSIYFIFFLPNINIQLHIRSVWQCLFDIWKCIQLQQQRHTLLCHLILDLSHSDIYLTKHNMDFGILSNVKTNCAKAATSVSAFKGAQCHKITLGTDRVNKCFILKGLIEK